jgi:NADH dehydrogenase
MPVDETNIPRARNGQVEVLSTLQVPGYPKVYVIGDLARVVENGLPLPMVAPVAIQQAIVAAGNIQKQIKGEQLTPFHYRDPGAMVAIGRNAAVAQLKGRSFIGFPAWLIWVGVHIFKLIGFRNRLVVMINWVWDYLFYERSVRLIIPLGQSNSKKFRSDR